MSDRKCQGVTRSGAPCKARPTPGTDHCVVHSPNAEVRARALAAKRAAGRKVLLPSDLEPPEVKTLEDLLALCNLVAQEGFRSRLDPKQISSLNGTIKEMKLILALMAARDGDKPKQKPLDEMTDEELCSAAGIDPAELHPEAN